jgi:phosphatidate cytidylyltransferase
MHLIKYFKNNIIFNSKIFNFIIRVLTSILIILFAFFCYKIGETASFIFLSIIFLLSFLEIYFIINSIFIFLIYSFVIFTNYLLISYNIFLGNLQFVYLIFFIASLHDIGGYIFGNLFGKYLIVPKISPKKSLEGFIGSVCFIWIGIALISYFYKIPIKNNIIICLLLAVMSFLGDIFFSKVKRIYNKKDFSNIIPGHGGILDRIDSIMFLSFFIKLMNIFN